MKVFIYSLSDPNTNEVRYVGKSMHPTKRLAQHIWKSRKPKTHRDRWILSLINSGFCPTLTILCESDDESWEKEEIRYIEKFRHLGFDLTNGTNGGEGIKAGTKLSKEHIEKIRTRALERGSFTPEHREKIAFANRIRSRTDAAKERIRTIGFLNKGRKMSDENRLKMSLRVSGTGNPRYGVKLTADIKKRISEAVSGTKNRNYGKHHSCETINKMRLARLKWHERKKLLIS